MPGMVKVASSYSCGSCGRQQDPSTAAPPRRSASLRLPGPFFLRHDTSILEVDTTRAKGMGAGASTPRKARPDGDADDETAVRAILGELDGCGVPQMGIAAESLRLAVASDGPMRNQVRSHLGARRCAAGLDFLIAVDDYKHTRGPDDDAVRDRAKEVHERFISIDAPAEVTLPRRVRDAVAHKISSGVVGDDIFAAAAAYVSKALARDALGDFVSAHRDDSLLLASL